MNKINWVRVYWEDTKDFLRGYGLILIGFIMIMVGLGYMLCCIKKQSEYIIELQDENLELLDDVSKLLKVELQLSKEIDFLVEDNQVLGSYLAEKEIKHDR
tara:strand:- start:885 stop:1187 length:303 start_codon:yes stop_codon:yes gene_type:complete